MCFRFKLCSVKKKDCLVYLAYNTTIHTRDLRFLVVEMFKAVKDLAPKILSDLFPLKEESYNLWFTFIV